MQKMIADMIDQMMKLPPRVYGMCRDSGGAVIRNGKWSYLENAGEHPAPTKKTGHWNADKRIGRNLTDN
jgi:hypothetical protein